MTSDRPRPPEQGLLLLAPSRGLGGGIERVADAVCKASGERVRRIDLLSPSSDDGTAPEVTWRLRIQFAARCLRAAVASRPRTVVCLHVSLLPIALATAMVGRAECALIALGRESWGRMSWARRWAVRSCDRLLAISSFTARWLAERARIDSTRVRVISLPIDPTLAELALTDPAAAEKADEPLLLTVARMEHDTRYKGLFDTAQSLPSVIQKFPNIRWEVVGDGPDRPELEGLCRQLGLQSVVAFRGRIEDSELIDAYRRAWIFVMPSIARPDVSPPIGEGFGLVYAEAGAFGVPSVASSAGGGSADVVIDGKTGLLVPPTDPEALANGIVRLLSDATLRRRLGAGARERVRTHHLPAHFEAALKTALGDAESASQ